MFQYLNEITDSSEQLYLGFEPNSLKYYIIRHLMQCNLYKIYNSNDRWKLFQGKKAPYKQVCPRFKGSLIAEKENLIFLNEKPTLM